MSWSLPLQIVLAVAALTSWCTGAIAAIRMTRHTLPGVSMFDLAINGMAFFTGSKFTPAAAPDLRRFRIAAAVFFALTVILGVVLVVSATEPLHGSLPHR